MEVCTLTTSCNEKFEWFLGKRNEYCSQSIRPSCDIEYVRCSMCFDTRDRWMEIGPSLDTSYTNVIDLQGENTNLLQGSLAAQWPACSIVIACPLLLWKSSRWTVGKYVHTGPATSNHRYKWNRLFKLEQDWTFCLLLPYMRLTHLLSWPWPTWSGLQYWRCTSLTENFYVWLVVI